MQNDTVESENGRCSCSPFWFSYSSTSSFVQFPSVEVSTVSLPLLVLVAAVTSTSSFSAYPSLARSLTNLSYRFCHPPRQPLINAPPSPLFPTFRLWVAFL